jgi:rhodanese-related sulfurtransferase
LRKINRRGPALLPHSRQLRPLSPTELRERIDAGTELIDVRSVEDFASEHVAGALSIPFRPQFATWLGWMVPEGRSIAFVIGEDQDRADIVRQCLKVGYEDLAGELAGGTEAWSAIGLPTAHIELVGPSSVTPDSVLDVRQASERAAGHIPGSVGVELGSLAERAEDLPPGPFTVVCAHGERAMTGASVLARSGRGQLTVLIGGPEEWAETTGRRLVRGP